VRTGSNGGGLVQASARHTLALWLIHRPTDAETPSLLYGIQHALDPNNYRLLIENPTADTWEAVKQAEERFLDRLTEDQDIAGALIWYIGGVQNLPALKRVRARRIPLVFLDRLPPKGFEADHVGIDNVASAEHAVRHLIQRGHRNIAHLSNVDAASTVAARLEGYRRALDSARIPFRPELVAQATGSDVEVNARCPALVEALLGVPDPPTALFVVNDRLALMMIEALRAAGRRVPDDMAVVGFDGIERWTPGPSFLTTINQPFERMGARAVDLLLHRIHSGFGTAFRHVLLEAPLSIHGSTVPARRAEGLLQTMQS
jgi:LacI family transcriptional regulator